MNKNNHIEYKKEQTLELDMASQPNMLYHDACLTIEQAKAVAFKAVNDTLIKRNRLLGMRIQHEVLKDKRAGYGQLVIKSLAKAVSQRYGEGFTKTNLYNNVSFNQSWPKFFHAASGKLKKDSENDIFHAMSGENENLISTLCPLYPIRLTWTHYRII